MFKALNKLVGGGDFNEIQLQPSTEAICATEARFCLPNSVTLKLREKFFSLSGDDFKISCATTGTPYFQCQGKVFSLREKKTIRDNAGVPVANFKEQLISLTDKFNVYAGDKSETKICKCSARFTFLKAKLTSEFQDVVTGKSRFLVLKGDWRDKRCVIYWGEPKQGGVPIAKIFRPLSLRSHFLETDGYLLEVSPGVDIALMVIMCIALDEHARD